MSLLQRNSADTTFGRGGDEPYARAISGGARVDLALRVDGSDASAASSQLDLDFGKWSAAADEVDHSLLRHARGPLLDIGCGPGRMVRAAGQLGLVALGLDASPEVVELARRDGLAVALGSVFDRVPAEGLWHTALLIDGNVGIGGDVAALLARCSEVLAASGVLIVEVHSDIDRDHSYNAVLVDSEGAESAAFPWAEVGVTRLGDIARSTGFTLDRVFTAGGRRFCRLIRA